MSRPERSRHGYLLTLLLACARPGEPADCLNERQEARNLALQGQLEAASRLLEHIKARCGANSASEIQHIGKLIEEKTRAKRALEQKEAEERKLRQQSPSRDFIAWATQKDGAVAGKVGPPLCAARGTPDFGFCEAPRQNAANMSVRYSSADPEAYRYALRTSIPPSCVDLGESRQVRAWSRGGRTYELCELTSRRLRHLTALVVHAPGEHEMYIYSEKYPALDSAFERQLRVIPPPQ
jgi:hypothetical protein